MVERDGRRQTADGGGRNYPVVHRPSSVVSDLPPRLWNVLLGIIYPPRCGGCDRRGTLMCVDCLADMVPIAPGLYSVDGLDALICVGVFAGPLRNAVHRLKYETDTPLARALAHLVSDALSADASWVAEDGTPPVLVPVPLHPTKRRARGYNQSELLRTS